MTSASRSRTDTAAAFARASAFAHSVADRPASRISHLIALSSIAAGSIENATPAVSSRWARIGLADARTTLSGVGAMAAHQELVDRRGGLLDRAAGHIDHRPMMLGKNAARLAYLGAHRLDIRVVGVLVVIEHAEPVAAQMDEPFGIVCQPDNQRLLRTAELRRERDARHKRDVRRLDAAIGEIETGRRLRGARYADKTDIRIVDAPGRLSVIVVDCKGHRVDAREIFIVEQMLPAGDAMALPPEIGGERADHGIEHRDRLDLQLPAAFLQGLAQRVVDEREQDEPGIGLDPGDDPLDLTARPYHAPDMLDRLRIVELHEAGARHRMHCLAGRIRDEVKVKAAQHGKTHRALWMARAVLSMQRGCVA